MYDPLTGRFNGIDPVFDFSTTGYAGMGNNPVSYIDPDGENPIVFVVAAAIGGVSNLISNWKKIKNFETGLAYFVSGAVGGAVSAVSGPGGGAITAGGNVAIDLANGNVPELKFNKETAFYAGGLVLDAVGAGGAGKAAKGLAARGLLGSAAKDFALKKAGKYTFVGGGQAISNAELAALAEEGIHPSVNFAAGVRRITQTGVGTLGQAAKTGTKLFGKEVVTTTEVASKNGTLFCINQMQKWNRSKMVEVVRVMPKTSRMKLSVC